MPWQLLFVLVPLENIVFSTVSHKSKARLFKTLFQIFSFHNIIIHILYTLSRVFVFSCVRSKIGLLLIPSSKTHFSKIVLEEFFREGQTRF